MSPGATDGKDGIHVECTLGNTVGISTGVVAGLFDLGLVEGEVRSSLSNHLEGQTVGSHHLQIVVGQSHPWFHQVGVYVPR